MDLLDKIKIDSKKNIDKEYVSLKTTTKLVDTLVEAHPKWEYLKKYYDVVDDPEKDKYFQIFVSFVNAIFTQERVWFTMGGSKFKKLVFDKDENWQNIDGKFANGAWTNFRNYIRDNNIAICHNEREDHRGSVDGKALMYELVDPSLLAYITVDPEAQKVEALDFIANEEEEDVPEDSSGYTPGYTPRIQVEDKDKVISNKVKDKEQVASQPTKKENIDKTKETMPFLDFFRVNLAHIPREIETAKEEMYMFAEQAANNTDFDPESASDKKTLKNYFKQKLNHKKDGYVNILVNAFADGYMDILAAKKAEGFEYKEPDPIDIKKVKMEMDIEKRQQEKVGAMLRVQFGGQTVQHLKEQLKTETDDLERMRLEAEIKIWGG